MIIAKFQTSVPESRDTGWSIKMLPCQCDKKVSEVCWTTIRTKWHHIGVTSLSSKHSLPDAASLLRRRHAKHAECSTPCMEMPFMPVTKCCERGVKHSWDQTWTSVLQHSQRHLPALNCAIRNLLLTWCQSSCMYRPSAVDLTVEGLPGAGRARACTLMRMTVAVSVIRYMCPLDLEVWTPWPCLCKAECWTWFSCVFIAIMNGLIWILWQGYDVLRIDTQNWDGRNLLLETLLEQRKPLTTLLNAFYDNDFNSSFVLPYQ